MNIQDAVKESLNTKKMIARKYYGEDVKFIPTNDCYNLVALFSNKKGRLPGRGWQPSADDLIADDWYITKTSYSELVIEM